MAGIFDVGDVLIENRVIQMRQDIKTTLGISDQLFQKHYFPLLKLFSVSKITETEFWDKLIDQTGAKGTLPATSLFKRTFFINNFNINQSLISFIRALKNRGILTAILSNTIKPHADLMRASRLTDNFDYVFLSNEIFLQKPDADIFEYALAKMSIKPQEAFFVDDIPEYVKAAQKLGLQGIHFTNTQDCINQINSLDIPK